MSRIIRFWRLPLSEKALLANTLLLVAAVRAGLWILPFQSMRRFSQRAAAHPRRPRVPSGCGRFTTARLIRAVLTASRYVPRATCLTQALAAQILLDRHGYPSCLRIGVAKGATGVFEAHAWLESEGVAILGGKDLGRYAPLLALGSDPV